MDNIKIMQWNACGIKAHFSYFSQYIESLSHRPDVICIQESFLKPDKRFSLRNYVSVRKDRIGAPKGGVLTLVNRAISFSTLTCPDDVESIGIRLMSSNGNLNIFNVYNPGVEILPDVYRSFFVSNSIICGDFNAHNPLWGATKTDARGTILETLITESDCVVLNDGIGTFIKNNGGLSPLDLTIIDKSLSSNSSWLVIDDDLGSDHFPILTTLNVRHSSNSSNRIHYNFNKANWPDYRTYIEQNLDNIVVTDNVDATLSSIVELITASADKTIPKSSPFCGKSQVPYWNKECDLAVKKKNRWRRKADKTKLLSDFIEYKKQKAICQRKIRTRQREYWHDYCSSLNSNSDLGKVWRMLKRMKGVGREPIPSLKGLNSVYSSDSDKANALANQFANVSSSSNHSQEFIDYKGTFEQEHNEEISVEQNNSSSLNVNISFHELKSVLNKSKNSAPGEDGISYVLYKELPGSLLIKILDLFNIIWNKGTLPMAWKQAVISPILKPGKDPTSVASYRPIALTSTLCKVMERIIVNRLNWFCEVHNIFNKYQSGFRKNKCTLDHILRLHEDVNKSLANKGKALAVFLDIEKAYDMVWREGLLYKLKSYGLDGQMFNWIRDFLSARTMKVRIGNTLSTEVSLENGTPQGSVISPILFILMINDLDVSLKNGVNYSIYADDIVLWKTGRNFKFITKCIQSSLNKVNDWFFKWGFKASTSKSVVLPFSRTPKDVTLELGSCPLSVVNNFKFLGVIFDSKLRWSFHIDYIRQKCIKRINLMKCISGTKWGASKQILVILYKGLIRSILDYGSMVYDSANTNLLSKLDVIQNRCLRLCCGALRQTRVSLLEVECGVPPLFLQRKILLLKYIARSVYFNGPVDFLEMDWRDSYGSFRMNNLPASLKSASFFEEIGPENIALYKVSPEPPWLNTQFKVDDSLTSVGKKHDQPHLLLNLAKEKIESYQQFTCIYTDGSKHDYASSAAFYVHNRDISFMFHLQQCSIYKAELYAIFEALTWIEKSDVSKALIVSDSLSSLISIRKGSSSNYPVLLMEVISCLLRLHQRIDIQFLWVPSHLGIKGNERADSLAKQAFNLDNKVSIALELREVYSAIESFERDLWQYNWSLLKGTHSYIEIVPNVSYKVKFTCEHRAKEVMLTRLRFNKTRLNGHLFKMKCHPTGLCDLCFDFVDPKHILFDCVFYQDKQASLVNLMYDANVPISYVSLLSNQYFYQHIFNFLSSIKILV